MKQIDFDLLLLKFIRLDKDNGPDLSKREFFKKNFDFFGELIKIKKHYTLSERVCFGKNAFKFVYKLRLPMRAGMRYLRELVLERKRACS